jgi:hypothetical protein
MSRLSRARHQNNIHISSSTGTYRESQTFHHQMSESIDRGIQDECLGATVAGGILTKDEVLP